jgi:hypothetical protein
LFLFLFCSQLNVGGGCLVQNVHEIGVHYELLQSSENLIQLKSNRKLIGRMLGYSYSGPYTAKVAFPLLSSKYTKDDKLYWMSEYLNCLDVKGVDVNDLLKVDCNILKRVIQSGCPESITLTPGQHTHFLLNKDQQVTKVML